MSRKVFRDGFSGKIRDYKIDGETVDFM